MTCLRPLLLGAVLPWLALAAPVRAAPTYYIQTFTVPGAASFNVGSINNSGQVVGTAFDAQFNASGFIETVATGNITTFVGPTGRFGNSTYADGINDAGTIFGLTSTLGYYLRDASGNFTAVSPPSLIGFRSLATGLSNSGQIVGVYDTRFDYRGRSEAFSEAGVLLDATTGSYVTINALPTTNATFVNGLNNLGQVVGEVYDFSRTSFLSQGFLYDSRTGVVTLLNVPDASVSNGLVAINDVGQAIGSYFDSSGQISHDFLLDLATRTYTDLPFDGTSINNAGQIVGNLRDSNGMPIAVGFIATPMASGPTTVPEPATFLLLLPTLLAAATRRRRTAR